jgi:hypothetical protein
MLGLSHSIILQIFFSALSKAHSGTATILVDELDADHHFNNMWVRRSAVDIWLLLCVDRSFNHSPDCFCTGGDVDLSASPIIHHPQEGLRNSHLEGAILSAFRRTTTRATNARHLCISCIDIKYTKA